MSILEARQAQHVLGKWRSEPVGLVAPGSPGWVLTTHYFDGDPEEGDGGFPWKGYWEEHQTVKHVLSNNALNDESPRAELVVPPGAQVEVANPWAPRAGPGAGVTHVHVGNDTAHLYINNIPYVVLVAFGRESRVAVGEPGTSFDFPGSFSGNDLSAGLRSPVLETSLTPDHQLLPGGVDVSLYTPAR